MSSKRGRKRNDNLPPNRARDVQRAFRARRAAHLEALEHRVAELEEENGNLRAALNLPPANRAPLGKGPTGKDKPKTGAGPPSRSSQAAALEAASCAGSSADSPTSTRAQSLSPSTITATMRPSSNTVHSLEGGSWDQGMILPEEQQNHHHHHQQHHHHPSGASTSSAYPLSGVPPPGGSHAKSNPSQYSSYGSTATQSSSRPTLPGTMYMSAVPQGTQSFAHAADRPLGEATYGGTGGGAGGGGGGSGGGNYAAVRDPREDQQQQRFPPYTQPSYSAAGEGGTHLSQHSSSTTLHYTTTQQQRDASSPAQTPVPFAHRRSITDPQGFSSLVNQYPHLPPPSGLRRLSPPRLAESSHSVRPSFNGGGS